MKRVRYSVAASLDGYIAGPNGEYDWIVIDPDIDFNAITAQFDTVIMGRKTYEVTYEQGGGAGLKLTKHEVYEKTGTMLLEYAVI